MYIKSKIITTAATLTVIVGVGAAGTLTANAATSACGPSCASLYSPALSLPAFPEAYVLDVPGPTQIGGRVILGQENGTNPGEDFRLEFEGTVHDYFLAGLISSGLDALYSSLNVYEMEYAPGGVDSGLCVGAFPVSLQECGTSTLKTVWIFDPQQTGFGTFDALINLATNNPQHPDSLTAVLPGLAPVTLPLATNFFPSLPIALQPLVEHQLWGVVYGVLPIH